MYVEKKYPNYKDEILQHLTVKEYQEFIIEKATEYFKSTKVRCMRAASTYIEYIHFGIGNGSAISIDHIMSIILYCDMDKYSTKFSETFRKLYSHETIYSVKKRNQEYWWQSKLFIETVEYFGEYGVTEKNKNGETGPFCM